MNFFKLKVFFIQNNSFNDLNNKSITNNSDNSNNRGDNDNNDKSYGNYNDKWIMKMNIVMLMIIIAIARKYLLHRKLYQDNKIVSWWIITVLKFYNRDDKDDGNNSNDGFDDKRVNLKPTITKNNELMLHKQLIK